MAPATICSDLRHNLPGCVWQFRSGKQTKEAGMATLYFHCVGTEEALMDRSGSEIDDLFDARARAFVVIQAIIASGGPEDWREWTVHVSDDDGEELLVVPFTSVLGKPH